MSEQMTRQQETIDRLLVDMNELRTWWKSEFGSDHNKGALDRRFDQIEDMLGQKLERITETTDKMENAIMGLGDQSNPGIIVRIDRLEQLEDSRKWSLRAAWGAIIVIAVRVVASLFGVPPG